MSDIGRQRGADSGLLDRVLIGAIILAALVARLLPGPRTIDDAYITFRYARNIAEGVGFVYNPGEHVLGTTTPLFAVLMAFIGSLTGRGDYPAFALLVSALADAATCALLYLLARKFLNNWLPALALGLLWAVAPMSVTFAIGGMETSVCILWMTATFWLYASGRDNWAALTAALGVLTRPDALIWADLVFLHQVWVRFRARNAHPLRDWLPWRAWAIFGAALLPWTVFALSSFGTVWPRSAGAKALTYILQPGATLIRLLQHFATPFFEYDALGVFGIGLGLLMYPLLFAVGALRIVRGIPGGGRALPMFVYPVLYALPFAAFNLLIFRWYLAPPLPAYFLGIVTGVWTLAGALTQMLGRRVAAHAGTQRPIPLQAIMFAIVAVAWLAFSLNAWTLHPDHGPDRPAPEMAYIQLELFYEEAARVLVNEYNVTADTVVSAGDIGAVGYFSRATILDTIGLVTPTSTAYYPIDPAIIAPGNNYAIPPALIRDAQPDYLVIVESYGRLGLMHDPEFLARYRLVETVDTTIYDSTGMQVFKRER